MPSIFNKTDNQEIISRIEKLTPNTEPGWGKMNPAQMLSHCQCPMNVAFGDLSLKSNFILLLVGRLYKKKILAAPGFKKNSPTAPDFIRNGECNFETSKSELIQKINLFSELGEKAIKSYKHPFFGTMSAEEWDVLQWKHLDHHLKQFGV
ncbi:MAG: DUF1569 domain-containing protein [Flavobacterium sp.]